MATRRCGSGDPQTTSKTMPLDYETIINEALTTDPGAICTLLCATIQRLKTNDPVENACSENTLEEGVKVHRICLPRPKPRDTSAMQTGGITGDQPAMRARPTGTAHDGLTTNPRQLRAARQNQVHVLGGGDGPVGVGASVAQDAAQTNRQNSQGKRNREGYVQRRAHKAQSLSGGDKSDTEDLVGDTVAASTDRNRPPAHSQSSTAGANSRSATAAKKSVKSERVAGSGRNSRDSRKVSRQSVGGALSGAGAERSSTSQSSVVAAVHGNYSAAAKKSELATKDAEIERLQRAVTKLERSQRDLKQRLHEEKEIADGMLSAKLLVEPLAQSGRQQQLHVADMLEQRAAAAKVAAAAAAKAVAAKTSAQAAAAETNKPTGGNSVETEGATTTGMTRGAATVFCRMYGVVYPRVLSDCVTPGEESAESKVAAPAEEEAAPAEVNTDADVRTDADVNSAENQTAVAAETATADTTDIADAGAAAEMAATATAVTTETVGTDEPATAAKAAVMETAVIVCTSCGRSFRIEDYRSPEDATFARQQCKCQQ